ncbi:hAT family C-terminal dimerization domain containing protein [Nitzschia inconspicua]|uniref:HAT family C-terminal dimerization domain containing protein n=1 Tax=Nitzschia inconspicua TaxID=303405 RepID=A0A9K3LX90_9STRA|nr:hAT family C-terminal dimerization domain containing protein [Nitzschia inconspicua]
MSQPSYPSEINPRASDEASNNMDVSYWLRPNEAAAALFKPKKSDSKRCSNPVWNFYHRVKRAKTDVPDKQLPYKWLQNSNKKSFMSCNGCGELVVSATLDEKNNRQFNPGSVTAQGMKTHLQSAKHSTTAEALEKIFLSQKQSTLTLWSKSGPLKLSPNEERAHQELAVTKWIVTTHQPLIGVEDPSFRSMIASFNKKAKPMGKHQIKQHILNLEGYMREASIKSMEGKSVSLTLDHWTSVANQNYTGMTAHFKSFSPMPYRKLLPSGNKVSNDPLKWWEEKAAYLPIMSSLAKAYLSIQATSAPSERVFSVASSFKAN